MAPNERRKGKQGRVVRLLSAPGRLFTERNGEVIELPSAFTRALSLGDNLESMATDLAQTMELSADILREGCELIALDPTKEEVTRPKVALAWDSLLVNIRFTQVWAGLDPEELPTENLKREAIVPRMPAFDRLQTQVKRIGTSLAGIPVKPEGKAPGIISFPDNPDSKAIPPAYDEPFGLTYADAMGMEFESAIKSLADFEKHFGSFHIWQKQPRWATCESLVRAWAAGDSDFEDYLAWMRRHEFRLLPIRLCRACKLAQATGRVSRKCRCYDASLDPYIMQVLLDMNAAHHDVKLGTEMQGLRNVVARRCKPDFDSELYVEILRLARNRKAKDETQPLYQRQITGHDDDGKPIKEPLLSLDAPEAGAIDDLFAQRKINERFRWRYRLDWNEVAQSLDDRTARELEQVLNGASVEEMNKTNYEHFRRAIPKIRGLAWQLQASQNH